MLDIRSTQNNVRDLWSHFTYTVTFIEDEKCFHITLHSFVFYGYFLFFTRHFDQLIGDLVSRKQWSKEVVEKPKV